MYVCMRVLYFSLPHSLIGLGNSVPPDRREATTFVEADSLFIGLCKTISD